MNPRDANAHNNLGYTYQMMKLPSRALPHYKRAVELEPNNPTFRYNYALVLAELGQWQEVATNLELVMRQTPTEVGGWLKLGEAYTRLRQPEKAIQVLQQGIAANPNHPDLHYNLGVAHLQRGNLAVWSPCLRERPELAPR